jgi:hypothetical protein
MAYLVDESGEEPVCSKSHDAPPPAHRGGANAARGGDGDITKSGAAAATHARTLTRRGSGEIDEGGCPHRASGVRGAAGGRRERKILKRFKCAPWRMIPWSSCRCNDKIYYQYDNTFFTKVAARTKLGQTEQQIVKSDNY